MRKIILMLILFVNILKSQIDSLEYLNYFPLHVGDKWVYEIIAYAPGFVDTMYTVEEVIGDTIMPNGKKYFTKSDGFNYRIDTTSFSIYRYGSIESAEFILSPFNTEFDSSYVNNSNGDSVLVVRSHEIGNAGYIKGQFDKIRYINCIVVPTTYVLTKGIGISQFNYFEVGGCEKTLLGAIINCMEYGNISEIISDIKNPIEFRLYPNYPNPFNANTKIKYEIQKPGNVTIQIFDITGNFIEIIEDSRQETGQYSTNWNASHYSSGIYLIQMQVGEFTQNEKCLLLK